MPYNGTGVFQALPPPNYPAVAGDTIRAEYFNAVINDLIAGLTTALTRDGQTPPTADLPMAGKKHTGVANAVANDQYAAYGQMVAAIAALGAALNASNLSSGTVPDARFPATLPAASGANLTNLPAGNLTGNIAAARMASAFTTSFGAADRLILPNGFMFQWGRNTVAASTNLAVSLPVTFPHAFLMPFASRADSNLTRTDRMGADIISTSQIQLQNPSTNTTDICWLALGW